MCFCLTLYEATNTCLVQSQGDYTGSVQTFQSAHVALSHVAALGCQMKLQKPYDKPILQISELPSGLLTADNCNQSSCCVAPVLCMLPHDTHA